MSTKQPLERVSSIKNHPMAEELKEKGITSKVTIETAMLVYLRLIEVEFWFDVEFAVHEERKMVFIKGRRTSEAKQTEYILPVDEEKSFDISRLNDCIDCCKIYGGTNDSLILAFVDSSSTVLFYKVTKGLVAPKAPSNKELEKMKKTPVWNEHQAKWKIPR